jgi:UDP-N-acetylglucosamine--N-acetylmuramyl-(pentapeptide) pyrophosphoryl-undecaprenol N-acetylglucosamine transferase
MRQCRDRFRLRRPAVVIGTGGFASAPAVRVAAEMGIPTALLNPDALPGRANRHLAPRVTCVFSQWEDSARHFPRGVRLEAEGCPVRPAFARAGVRARHEDFALSPRQKTLLVTGASLGARSINDAMLCLAEELAALDGWQVFHVTGTADLSRVVNAYDRAGVGAVCVAYTERMADVMALADLVVSRAGASTVAEIAALGKPSVLLPYPYHRDMHQLANAEALASRGAALICRDWKDGPRTAEGMKKDLFALLRDSAKLEAMGRAALDMGRPDAALRIAQRLLSMMGKSAGST